MSKTEVYGWDIDGTMHPGSLFVDMLSFSLENGLVDVERLDHDKSESGVVTRFLREITGRSLSDFADFTNELTRRAESTVRPWVADLQQEQAQRGDVILPSQSPDFAVSAFAKGLPWVKWAQGSTYSRDATGVFTGLTTSARKGILATKYLDQIDQQRGPILSEAYGDSIIDAPMLLLAERGFLVDPEDDVGRMAPECGWTVLNSDGQVIDPVL